MIALYLYSPDGRQYGRVQTPLIKAACVRGLGGRAEQLRRPGGRLSVVLAVDASLKTFLK